MIELIFVVFWMSINLVVVLHLFDFSNYSYIINISSIAGITVASSTITLVFFALIVKFISHFLNAVKKKVRGKKISEFLKKIPDNCYIDKVDNKFYIKPLNFLSSHQKLNIQKNYADELKDMPGFLLKEISLFKNYGMDICYIKYNEKLTLSEFVLENEEKIFYIKSL